MIACEACHEIDCECDIKAGEFVIVTEGAYDDHRVEGVVRALRPFSIYDAVVGLFPDCPQDIRRELLAYRGVIKHLLARGYIEKVKTKQLHHDYLERHPVVTDLELDVESL